jgi:glycosyltransferase involved in cell wall biosynthesis
MRTAHLPCPVYVLGYNGFLKPSLPNVLRKFGRLIDDLDIDLVHSFFDESIIVSWMGARWARRTPVLVSSRRDMGLGAANQPWYHRLFPFVLAWANRDFAGIVANSQVVKEYAAHRERTAQAKFTVIRNGVEIAQACQEIPDLLLEAPDALKVGIAASLTPVKRHDVLLRAWGQVVRLDPGRDAVLYLLGDGPQRPALTKLVAALGLSGQVHFVGVVDNVHAWLPHLEVGVLCSDREGLSNAILEYMACGLPVVATAVGGNPELVDQENGLLVPPGDPEALAAALAKLLADAELRRRLGEASRRRVTESFSWDRSMQQLMAYYDAMLSRQSGPSQPEQEI